MQPFKEPHHNWTSNYISHHGVIITIPLQWNQFHMVGLTLRMFASFIPRDLSTCICIKKSRSADRIKYTRENRTTKLEELEEEVAGLPETSRRPKCCESHGLHEDQTEHQPICEQTFLA